MPVKNIQEPTEDLFIIFGSDTDYHAKMLTESFLKKNLTTISDSAQEEFEELICDDSDKKRFVRAVSKIFVVLLNTKVDSAEKIRRIIKIAIETTIKIWQ